MANSTGSSGRVAATGRTRFLASLMCGALAGAAMVWAHQLRYAPLVAWDATALAFAGSALLNVLPMNAAETKKHALQENPGRAVGEVLLILTSLASIAAVVVLLFLASDAEGLKKALDIALGLGSIVVSWAVVHTIFMLNYARQYYGESDGPEGGIDFNDTHQPKYSDFAYLAFTIGMTFQVSDTQIKTPHLRAMVLRQALLSYIFGTAIIATTINTLASIAK